MRVARMLFGLDFMRYLGIDARNAREQQKVKR